MTPKEKAEELYGKLAMHLRANLMYDEDANEDAKQCALIAVDEILENINETFQGFLDADLVAYWQLVKKEINKL